MPRWEKTTALAPLALLAGAWIASLEAPEAAPGNPSIDEPGAAALPPTSVEAPELTRAGEPREALSPTVVLAPEALAPPPPKAAAGQVPPTTTTAPETETAVAAPADTSGTRTTPPPPPPPTTFAPSASTPLPTSQPPTSQPPTRQPPAPPPPAPEPPAPPPPAPEPPAPPSPAPEPPTAHLPDVETPDPEVVVATVVERLETVAEATRFCASHLPGEPTLEMVQACGERLVGSTVEEAERQLSGSLDDVLNRLGLESLLPLPDQPCVAVVGRSCN